MKSMRQLDDLRKLRHVVGVARAGSFTSASSMLNLSQSALTKSVADVEAMLGMPLFERLHRGVRLTEAGEVFLPRAERLLADAGDLLLDLQEVRNLAAGRLRLGVAPSAFATFLESTVSAFAKVYPAVSIEVEDAAVDTVARAVLRGDLDLFVGSVSHMQAWQGLATEGVAPLYAFFIARLDHPLAQREPDARALLEYPVVMPSGGVPLQEELRRAYTDAGLPPLPARYVANHFPLVKEIVKATDAISPVISLTQPGEIFQKQFRTFKHAVKLSEQTLGVGWAAAREKGPTVQAFVDIFRGFLQDLAS